jgi:hypothetical protein
VSADPSDASQPVKPDPPALFASTRCRMPADPAPDPVRVMVVLPSAA